MGIRLRLASKKFLKRNWYKYLIPKRHSYCSEMEPNKEFFRDGKIYYWLVFRIYIYKFKKRGE